MNSSTLYHVTSNGRQAGPFTLEQLHSMREAGTINVQMLYWTEGAPGWEPLTRLLPPDPSPTLELVPYQPRPMPPPPPAAPAYYAPPVAPGPPMIQRTVATMFCRHCSTPLSTHAVMCVACGAPTATAMAPYGQFTGLPKSRVAYILLGLFLGGLGIHNFYAGYVGRGIAQLLLTLMLGWLILPLLVVGLWVLIEVCVEGRDSRGMPFA